MSEVKEFPTQEQEDIEVRTDIEAGWQLKRRKEILADRDELVAYYEEQIRKVKEDADFKVANIDRSLYAFFMTCKHKKTKTQEYYQHPFGKLMLKKQNPEYKRDDKTVIEWLKQTPETQRYIKVEEKLDWAALKADTTVLGNSIINTDGETIPGVEVIEREDKFCIE